MVTRLFSFVGTLRRSAVGRRVAEEAAVLERQARDGAPDSRAQYFNRIGDLYAKAGDAKAAISHYGRAIDSYLETGYFDAAAAMCRKVIDAAPDVVRARCTLAFLSLGKGLRQDAIEQITDYVRSAQRARQDDLAIERLRMMSEATEDEEIRLLLGEFLTELGDAEGANDVFGTVYARRNHLSAPPPVEDQRERWARALRKAVKLSDENAGAQLALIGEGLSMAGGR